jgi:hypothetical protein
VFFAIIGAWNLEFGSGDGSAVNPELAKAAKVEKEEKVAGRLRPLVL